MLVGCACLLVAAGFISEVPPALATRLVCTNETTGVFTQTKTMPDKRQFVSRGTFRIRPGRDFEWAVKEPFETCFYSTSQKYVYTNEDERVERELAELPYFSRLGAVMAGDYSLFFSTFDALYKEEDGRFFVKAKPKVRELKAVLRQVEVEGGESGFAIISTFPDGTAFRIDIEEDGK